MAVAPPTTTGINETGRVLATLDDWRAITFILVVLLFLAFLERWYAAHRFSKEREKMWEIAQQMGANAKEIAGAMNDMAIEVRAFRLVSARVESVADAKEQG